MPHYTLTVKWKHVWGNLSKQLSAIINVYNNNNKYLPISGVFSSSSCAIQLEPFVSATMMEEISCSGLWHQLLKSWKFSSHGFKSRAGENVGGGNIDAAESIFCDHVAVSKQTNTIQQPFQKYSKAGITIHPYATDCALGRVLDAHKHFKISAINSERYVQ